MNWEAFTQVIVWAAFIISVVSALFTAMTALDGDFDSQGVRIVLAISTACAIVIFAVIYGMGWLR